MLIRGADAPPSNDDMVFVADTAPSDEGIMGFVADAASSNDGMVFRAPLERRHGL